MFEEKMFLTVFADSPVNNLGSLMIDVMAKQERVNVAEPDGAKMITTSWTECGEMKFYIGNYVKETVKVRFTWIFSFKNYMDFVCR